MDHKINVCVCIRITRERVGSLVNADSWVSASDILILCLSLLLRHEAWDSSVLKCGQVWCRVCIVGGALVCWIQKKHWRGGISLCLGVGSGEASQLIHVVWTLGFEACIGVQQAEKTIACKKTELWIIVIYLEHYFFHVIGGGWRKTVGDEIKERRVISV